MDVTLVEAECKKQYEGQICKKENGSTLYPKAKTTRPHKRNNSCHCTPIGHTKWPRVQRANRIAARFETWYGKKAA